MRAAEALLLLAVAAAACAAAAVWGWRRWRARYSRWKVVEHSHGDSIVFTAERDDEIAMRLGAVARDDECFDVHLYELRAIARERVYALNQRGRPRHRLLRRLL